MGGRKGHRKGSGSIGCSQAVKHGSAESFQNDFPKLTVQ